MIFHRDCEHFLEMEDILSALNGLEGFVGGLRLGFSTFTQDGERINNEETTMAIALCQVISEQRSQACKDFLKEAYCAEVANATMCSSV